MSKWTMAVFLGAGLLAVGLAAGQQPTSKLAAKKGWLDNLNNATAQARKTDKPLMVVLRCDP